MWYCGLVTRPPHELNDPAVQARIVEMALAGASIRAIAAELGYDRKTLARRRDRPDEFGRLLTTALRSARQAQAEASPPKPPPKPKGPPKPCQVGRPSRLNDPGIQAQIVAMTLAGQSLPKIASVLGCSSKALTRAQQRMPAFRDKVEAATATQQADNNAEAVRQTDRYVHTTEIIRERTDDAVHAVQAVPGASAPLSDDVRGAWAAGIDGMRGGSDVAAGDGPADVPH